MKIFSTTKNLVLVVLFVSSFALNVATLASTVVATTLSAMFKTVTGITSVLGKRQTTVRNITKRISRRTVTGTARNLSMMYGEAVPYIGVAVIIGATAWDLKDACETLEDLHHLEKSFNAEETINEDVNEVCGQKTPTQEEVWSAVKNSPREIFMATKEILPDLPDLNFPSLNSQLKTNFEFIENIIGKWQ